VSTNRTLVKLVAVQAVGCSEAVDFGEDLFLLGHEPLELAFRVAERGEVLRDQGAHRVALLGRPDPVLAVDS